jgi:SAM-dependent methyltransferase
VTPPELGDGWNGYLATFHTERPGITEAILGRSRSDDVGDPYDWLIDALPDQGAVVDVACGSGPLATRLPDRWIGLDLSPAELGLAGKAATGRVMVADATAAPVRTGGVDAVICSMALMLLRDPGAAVVEMARLLRVGGLLVALVPATAPLTVRDRIRYARLLAALRLRRLPFRHHGVLDDPGPLLTPAGLTVIDVDQRRFGYPLTHHDDGLLFTRSLYLPKLDQRRRCAAQRITSRWTGTRVGIPLRRLIATKHPPTRHQTGHPHAPPVIR